MFTKIRRAVLLAASGAVMAGLAATAGAGTASATPAHDGGCWCIQADRPAANSAVTTAAVAAPMEEGPVYRGTVDANGVRIHKWPQLNAPVLGLAYDNQEVGVLSWGPVWDELIWDGREAWISAQYVYSSGLSY